MDVICVRDEVGGLHSTNFHIKLRNPVLDQTALALLGYDDYIRDSSNQSSISRSTTADLLEISSGAVQDDSACTSSWRSTRATKPSTTTRSTIFGSHSKYSPQETDLVEITCNAVELENITAFVAADLYVRFYDSESRVVSRTPTSRLLAQFGLVGGKNSIICRNIATGVYKAFDVWLYDKDEQLVVVDIDGTITKSDITGYIQTVYMGVFSYIHDGVVPFLNILEETYNYRIIYLTSRPMAHLKETKQFLQGIKDESDLTMPAGPLFPSKDRVMAALYREMISKTTVALKEGTLNEIAAVFSDAGSRRISPFVLGIGNKENDALAYNLAGMNAERILLIDTGSQLTVWKYQNQYQHNQSYHSKQQSKYQHQSKAMRDASATAAAGSTWCVESDSDASPPPPAVMHYNSSSSAPGTSSAPAPSTSLTGVGSMNPNPPPPPPPLGTESGRSLSMATVASDSGGLFGRDDGLNGIDRAVRASESSALAAARAASTAPSGSLKQQRQQATGSRKAFGAPLMAAGKKFLMRRSSSTSASASAAAEAVTGQGGGSGNSSSYDGLPEEEITELSRDRDQSDFGGYGGGGGSSGRGGLKGPGERHFNSKGFSETVATNSITQAIGQSCGVDVGTSYASNNFAHRDDVSDIVRYKFNTYKDLRLLQYIDKLAGMSTF